MEREVLVPVPGAELPGRLAVPGGAGSVVVFAHGSGSSRHSPRNRDVAEHLEGEGIGTLLIDLLTVPEAQDRGNVFDVRLLASRLTAVSGWLTEGEATGGLRQGFFGASTGAAAALWAAAEPGSAVGAVVSRGGRPDLAAGRLGMVRAPTLLVVGGGDDVVLDLNRDALRRLTTTARLEVVPGAGHLFEEPGALERVAGLAAAWFVRYLA